MSSNINGLKNLCISDFDYVSVDIFDTLLLRSGNPEFLRFYKSAKYSAFLCGEDKSQIYSIYYARLKSHQWLYQLYDKGLLNEPSLEDVLCLQLKFLQNSRLKFDKLLSAELSVECNDLTLNIELFNYLKECVDLGKKVFLLSDMYLSTKFIQYLLKSKGFDIECSIFVSNEQKKSKKKGDVFKMICSHFGTLPSKIIHIGDNYQSDYVNARTNGFNAFLLKRSDFFYFKERVYKNLYSYILGDI